MAYKKKDKLSNLNEALRTKRITQEEYAAKIVELKVTTVTEVQKAGIAYIREFFSEQFPEENGLINSLEMVELAKLGRKVLKKFLESNDPKQEAYALGILTKPVAASGLTLDCNLTEIYKKTKDLDAALKYKKLLQNDPDSKPKTETYIGMFEDIEDIKQLEILDNADNTEVFQPTE